MSPRNVSLLIRALIPLGAILHSAAASAQQPENTKAAPAPNVILITMDTVRACSIGFCGLEDPRTTPRLDELAKVATYHPRAISTSNWTAPTHLSLFTGQFTFEHGVRWSEPVPNPKDPGRNKIDLRGIDPDSPMIAETFKSMGYETAAFVTNGGYINPKVLPGIDRGFDQFELRPGAPGVWINQFILRWMVRFEAVTPRKGRQYRGLPFFLFINYMDAHTIWNTTPINDWIISNVRQDEGHNDGCYFMLKAVLDEQRYDAAAVERALNQYHAGIMNLDAAIGDLIDTLRRWGLYDNTLILITSDHGEFIGEHMLGSHAISLHEEGIRVPLLIKYPGQTEGKVDEAFVTSPDVPRMILDGLGYKKAQAFTDKYPYMPGNHPVIAEHYWGTFINPPNERFARIQHAAYDWPWKTIRTVGGEIELYNVEEDPGEQKNLAGTMPGVARRVMNLYDKFRREKGDAKPDEGGDEAREVELDEEAQRELKALGYLR